MMSGDEILVFTVLALVLGIAAIRLAQRGRAIRAIRRACEAEDAVVIFEDQQATTIQSRYFTGTKIDAFGFCHCQRIGEAEHCQQTFAPSASNPFEEPRGSYVEAFINDDGQVKQAITLVRHTHVCMTCNYPMACKVTTLEGHRLICHKCARSFERGAYELTDYSEMTYEKAVDEIFQFALSSNPINRAAVLNDRQTFSVVGKSVPLKRSHQ